MTIDCTIVNSYSNEKCPKFEFPVLTTYKGEYFDLVLAIDPTTLMNSTMHTATPEKSYEQICNELKKDGIDFKSVAHTSLRLYVEQVGQPITGRAKQAKYYAYFRLTPKGQELYMKKIKKFVS